MPWQRQTHLSTSCKTLSYIINMKVYTHTRAVPNKRHVLGVFVHKQVSTKQQYTPSNFIDDNKGITRDNLATEKRTSAVKESRFINTFHVVSVGGIVVELKLRAANICG